MRTWLSLSARDLLGDAPSQAADLSGRLRSQVLEPLRANASLAKDLVALVLLLLERPDPASLALAAIVEILKQSLAQWTTTVGAHLLVTPCVRVTPTEVLSEMTRRPNRSQFSGGLGAWYNVFAKSVYDAGDDARPQYEPNHWVGASVLLFGAPGLAALLYAVSLLSHLMRDMLPQDLLDQALPIPQGLRVSAQAPTASGQRAFHVVWRPSDVVPRAASFAPDARVNVVATRVYVKATPFGPGDIGDALAALEVERIEIPSLAVTTRILVPEGQVRYAALGYECIVEEEASGTDPVRTTVKHYAITQGLRLDAASAARTHLGGGPAPNWIALSSTFDLLPGLREVVAGLIAQLDAVQNEIIGDALQDAQDAAELAEQALVALIERVDAVVSLLLAIETVLRALGELSLYSYTFLGPGGSDMLVDEVQQALYGDAANKPPQSWYDNGAYIVGAVLVVGAGAPQPLELALSLMSTLMGLPEAARVARRDPNAVASPYNLPGGAVAVSGDGLTVQMLEEAFNQTARTMDAQRDELLGRTPAT